MHLLKTSFLSLALVVSQTLFANTPTEAELERWFNNDSPNPPEFKQEVNEGVLSFLNKHPIKPVHHHENTLTLYKDSLSDGWVKLEQCHTNLDRVERLQITFHKARVKNIKIIKALSVDAAWVENNNVQLKGVHNNAVLCIQAWTKALVKTADGNYRMSNGPFMRKFLDGYYPLHVTINVNYKETDLKLVQIEPIAQSGFTVTRSIKNINMDAWFEGRLKTKLTFIN